MTPQQELRAATASLLNRVEAATESPGERYTVDTSSEHGLIVGSYAPGDVDDEGTISTSCAAYFAYPGDDDQTTYGRAFAVASLMAGVDPVASQELAAWLTATAEAWDSLPGPVRMAAARFAQSYLRINEMATGR